jgi:hypothetical protein
LVVFLLLLLVLIVLGVLVGDVRHHGLVHGGRLYGGAYLILTHPITPETHPVYSHLGSGRWTVVHAVDEADHISKVKIVEISGSVESHLCHVQGCLF